MKMTNVKIFYHNDLDGKAAAASVLHKYVFTSEGRLKVANRDSLHKVDYNKYIPDASLVEVGEEVIIVDYSFKADTKYQLDEILAKASKVIWIDHHASSVEFLEAYPEYKDISNLEMLIDISRSGAYLAYTYFSKAKTIPFFIQLVDDYDRWIHKHKESKLLNIGMQAAADNPCDPTWANIFNEFNEYKVGEGSTLYEVIELGATLQDYINGINIKDFKTRSYEITIFGHKAIVMNKSGNSDVLTEEFYKYDIGIIWTFNGGDYTHSIYSRNKDIQCHKIAELFGGGGHPGAAGFKSKKMLFTKDIEWIAQTRTAIVNTKEIDIATLNNTGLLEMSVRDKKVETFTEIMKLEKSTGHLLLYKTIKLEEGDK